jgi:hypothetical protein
LDPAAIPVEEPEDVVSNKLNVAEFVVDPVRFANTWQFPIVKSTELRSETPAKSCVVITKDCEEPEPITGETATMVTPGLSCTRGRLWRWAVM